MQKNLRKNSKNTHRPHVKWGSLVSAVICITVELALFIFHIYGASGNLVGASVSIGYISAYGFIFGSVLLLVAGIEIFECFMPSYRRVKKYEDSLAYKATIYKYIEDARRDAYRNETKVYEEFLREFEM